MATVSSRPARRAASAQVSEQSPLGDGQAVNGGSEAQLGPRPAISTRALKGILLDVGCGASKQPGAVGMDAQALPGVDVVHSWNDFPWPFEDESVLTIIASHVVEHVSPIDGHFLRWMDECWRILQPERQLAIVTPYAGSPGFWQDPTHCNGCTEATFFYFDPAHDSGFWHFYKPRPWRIKLNFFHREGNLEVVLCKRTEIAICGSQEGDCPREAGHDGPCWSYHQVTPGINNFAVGVKIAEGQKVRFEWGAACPLSIEAVAYRLRDEMRQLGGKR